MARLNIDLRSDIYASLREKASDEGRSVSDVVRVLINNWLSDKEMEARFVQEVRELKRRQANGDKL